MAKKTISFNIDEGDLKLLDGYAKNSERDRSYVINDAIKRFIAETEAFHAELDAAEAAIERGEGIPMEEVVAYFEKKKADRKASEAKERKAS